MYFSGCYMVQVGSIQFPPRGVDKYSCIEFTINSLNVNFRLNHTVITFRVLTFINKYLRPTHESSAVNDFISTPLKLFIPYFFF